MSERKRPDYLPRETLFGLHHACAHIERAYGGYGCYLVGSVLSRHDYRDVDVRCILSDDEFEALFPKDADGLRPRWMLMSMALSAWLRYLTDLPIDFQFQKQTVANEKHKGPRSSLGHFFLGGDAT